MKIVRFKRRHMLVGLLVISIQAERTGLLWPCRAPTSSSVHNAQPVEPNNILDGNLSGGTHPNGDETTNNDGWAAASGTSAPSSADLLEYVP